MQRLDKADDNGMMRWRGDVACAFSVTAVPGKSGRGQVSRGGDEFGESAAFRDDGVGVGRCAEGGVSERARVDEGDGAVFHYLRGVGVSEKDEAAPEFLGAQGEGEQVRLHAVTVPVGEQDLHSFHLRHRFLGEGEIVAVALDGEEALVQGKVAHPRRPVSEEKDVVALLRDGEEPRRESAFVDVGKCEYRFHADFVRHGVIDIMQCLCAEMCR